MSDYPQDIRRMAEKTAVQWLAHVGKFGKEAQPLSDAIAEALMAERERCARIAEKLAADRRAHEAERGFGPQTATVDANAYWCEEIAEAIRSQPDTSKGTA